MSVNVEISIGEFFDKITILEIKKERIHDAEKLANITRELDALNVLLAWAFVYGYWTRTRWCWWVGGMPSASNPRSCSSPRSVASVGW